MGSARVSESRWSLLSPSVRIDPHRSLDLTKSRCRSPGRPVPPITGRVPENSGEDEEGREAMALHHRSPETSRTESTTVPSSARLPGLHVGSTFTRSPSGFSLVHRNNTSMSMEFSVLIEVKSIKKKA